MSERLPKSERLCSQRQMETLFAKGRRGNVEPVSYRWALSGAAEVQPPAVVMFSVPKKAFKRAWKRNLIKRRMRESYRKRKSELTEALAAKSLHMDIAFVCAKTPTIPDYKTIDDAIARILDQILSRS